MEPIITSYRSTGARERLQSVDFSSVGGNNYAFFQCYDLEGLEAIQRLMTAPPLSQEVVASTFVNGKPMLITRNHTSPFTLLEALKNTSESLEPVREKKGFDAWKVRSALGFGGQTLQMISAFLRPDRRVDTSVFVFAASNLAANTMNMVYEGEKVEDKHQLNYLKQRINRELAPHLKAGENPISIHEERAKLRETDDKNVPLEQAKGFMRRHSVQIGELGLRYLGAIGLAFPARYWKAAWQQKKIPQMDSSLYRRYTGVSSILGKSVAFGSRIPDPYNPKPASWLDELREKYTFLAGGLIEVTSFSALAYDCFFHSSGEKNNNWKRGLLINGKQHRDWLGGIGATMFVLGYIVRSFAKFGEREVNMKELYAHASDTLAQTAPDKVPQLIANTAAGLTEHFEGQKQAHFASIYTNLINDLAKFHHLNLGTQSAPTTAAPTEPKAPVALIEKPTSIVRNVSHQAPAANAPIFAQTATGR